MYPFFARAFIRFLLSLIHLDIYIYEFVIAHTGSMRTGALLLVLLEKSAAFKAIVDTSASAWESSLIFRSQLSPSSSSSTWKNCHDTRRSVHFPRPAKSRDRSAVPLPDLSQARVASLSINISRKFGWVR